MCLRSFRFSFSKDFIILEGQYEPTKYRENSHLPNLEMTTNITVVLYVESLYIPIQFINLFCLPTLQTLISSIQHSCKISSISAQGICIDRYALLSWNLYN